MKKIVTLAGDGIGPEIMAAGLEVLTLLLKRLTLTMKLKQKLLEVQELMPVGIRFLMIP